MGRVRRARDLPAMVAVVMVAVPSGPLALVSSTASTSAATSSEWEDILASSSLSVTGEGWSGSGAG